MDIVNLTFSEDAEFISRVAEESGQDMQRCYQCGNCTAGCPFTFAYDIPVNQIMRLVQAGQKDKVLSSKSIWLCASCQTCTTRCPCDIDVARVMDVLRHMARREGYASEKQVKQFVDSFIDSVEKHGRVFELGLFADYVRKTGRVLTDIELGPKVLLKRKLHFKPHEMQGKDHVAAIIKRFKQESR